MYSLLIWVGIVFLSFSAFLIFSVLASKVFAMIEKKLESMGVKESWNMSVIIGLSLFGVVAILAAVGLKYLGAI